MLKIGLTGGIGSGKSLVADIFSRLGAPVYISDSTAKVLMNTNEALKKLLSAEFGESIYSDNQLNRKKLADLIFNDDLKLEKVNSIVHPFVREDFEKWCSQKNEEPYIINESAIAFSSGLYKALDKVISVIAPLDLRIKRVIKRDQTSREIVEKIAAAQLTDKERIAKSDYLLYNDEEQLLVPQLLSLHKTLTKLN